MFSPFSLSFTVLFWDFYFEKTTIAVVKGLFPSMSRESDGSWLFLWWKAALIVSPRKGIRHAQGECSSSQAA